MFVSREDPEVNTIALDVITFFPASPATRLDTVDADFSFQLTRTICPAIDIPSHCQLAIYGLPAQNVEYFDVIAALLAIPTWVSLREVYTAGDFPGELAFLYDDKDPLITFEDIKEFTLRVVDVLITHELPPGVYEGLDARETKSRENARNEQSHRKL